MCSTRPTASTWWPWSIWTRTGPAGSLEPRGVTATSDLGSVLDRTDVESVSVCVPSGLHAGVGEQVLQAGKHLLMEKPLDVTLAAADRVIAAERASGRTVGVVSQRRFQPAFAFLRGLVESGRIGRVTSCLSESPFWRTQDYYDGGDWRGTVELDGGGALMNQGVHGLDILLWLLGDPVEVTARWATLAHERIEVEDTLSATIVFDSGAVGTMTATTAAYPGRSVRVTLSGTDGTAIVDDERLASLQLRDGSTADGADGRPGVLDTTQSLARPVRRLRRGDRRRTSTAGRHDAGPAGPGHRARHLRLGPRRRDAHDGRPARRRRPPTRQARERIPGLASGACARGNVERHLGGPRPGRRSGCRDVCRRQDRLGRSSGRSDRRLRRRCGE